MSGGLHVDSIIKSYFSHQVLTDIYLSCQKGEILGLLGRNGAGKSTLLKIIFGSLPAEGRFVKIDDKRIANLFEGRKLISYLPQDHFLPNHVKIKKIISLMCVKNNKACLFENDLVKPLLNKTSRELSGGERRLLELYLIIYSEAEYILIDEPFNGIAPVYREEIKELILAQSQNKGFIITDHDYRNILDIATRVVLMHDGGIREIKKKEDLIEWGYLSGLE